MASSHDMKYLEYARLKTEGEPVYDDPADELLVHASERFAFGFYDWHGIFGSFEQTKEVVAARVFNGDIPGWIPASAHIWVPMAVAGVIIKNPVVTRRFWAGWGK